MKIIRKCNPDKPFTWEKADYGDHVKWTLLNSSESQEKYAGLSMQATTSRHECAFALRLAKAALRNRLQSSDHRITH